jgi:hypothetical protein
MFGVSQLGFSPMSRRRTLFSLFTAALVVACFESKEDAANRTALTPIVHRHRALTDEYVRWVDREGDGGVTWGQSFAQLEKFTTAKESLLAELRKVVPTARYDCVIRLTTRSIETDIATISARLSASRQRLNASSAADLAKKYVSEARTSEYSSSMWINSAKEQYEDELKALQQAKAFQESSNRQAGQAQFVMDTLAATVVSMKLLPSMDRLRYPVVTDSGRDTLLSLPASAPRSACR